MTHTSQPCARVLRLLSQHMDGQLSPERARAVRLHLVRCSACSVEERALLALARAARSLPLDPPDSDLAPRVRARATPWLSRSSVRTGSLVAAALIGVVAAGFFSYRAGFARGEVQGERRQVSHIQADPIPGYQGQGGPVPDRLPAVDETLPNARLASYLPDDRTAVRASQSLFADLHLLDTVPRSLHHPLLTAQMQRFALDRWARSEGDQRPDPLREVAGLVRQLSDALADDRDLCSLTNLRSDSAREDLWSQAHAAVRQDEDWNPGLRRVFTDLPPELSGDTRRSLEHWLTFKESWVQGSETPDALFGLLDQLPAILPRESLEVLGGDSFLFPDLQDLTDRIEWVEDENGNRSGELRLDQRTENGFRSISISIQRSGTGGGR